MVSLHPFLWLPSLAVKLHLFPWWCHPWWCHTCFYGYTAPVSMVTPHYTFSIWFPGDATPISMVMLHSFPGIHFIHFHGHATSHTCFYGYTTPFPWLLHTQFHHYITHISVSMVTLHPFPWLYYANLHGYIVPNSMVTLYPFLWLHFIHFDFYMIYFHGFATFIFPGDATPVTMVTLHRDLAF